MSVVLLVGAALLLTSYARMQAVDRGFDEDRILVFTVQAPSPANDADDATAVDDAEAIRVTNFYERVVDRLRALPGADAVAAATAPPFRGVDQSSFHLEDLDDEVRSMEQRVTPGYFEAMGIQLLRGRLFDARDAASAPPVKVINQTMARAFWPGPLDDVLGEQILEGNAREAHTIIGIVSDAHYRGLDREVQPFRYGSLSQDPWRGRGQMVLRSSGDPLGLAAAARAAVWEIDGQAAVGEFQSMAELVSQSVATPRFRTLLLTLLALVAVGLTVVGVYGVISYSVARSTREIAVRMALGAARWDVARGVLGHGVRLIAVGILVGVAVALAATRVIQSYLFEVQATDPWTLATAATLVGLAATAAILVPAARATGVDPLVALRTGLTTAWLRRGPAVSPSSLYGRPHARRPARGPAQGLQGRNCPEDHHQHRSQDTYLRIIFEHERTF